MPDRHRLRLDARFRGAEDRGRPGRRVDVDGVSAGNGDAEQVSEQPEHAADDAVDREPGAQGLVVESMPLLAHALRVKFTHTRWLRCR